MSNEFIVLIVILVYFLIKDVIWTWKEIQLIDRSLPRSDSENKVKWFVTQMRELLKKSKKVSKKKVEKTPPPMIDTGVETPKMGPENEIHKQGVDAW